jgi:hypothetical protein
MIYSLVEEILVIGVSTCAHHPENWTAFRVAIGKHIGSEVYHRQFEPPGQFGLRLEDRHPRRAASSGAVQGTSILGGERH